jgi:uncharacterized damage-inducible protein DinB
MTKLHPVEYDLTTAVPLLERTPGALAALLDGLPRAWTSVNEGPNTWTVHDVVAHLIHAENDDWMPRVRHILEVGEREPFHPFDRTSSMAEARARPLEELTAEFAARRRASLAELAARRLTSADLTRRGRHPDFGPVTLGQHLATWVAHDLTHLSQIVRVMAAQYREAVGPWAAYLRVVRPL